MAPTHPTRSPLNTFYLDGDVVLRSETSPSQIHDGGARRADLHGLARPLLPARHGRCHPLPDLPPGRGPRRRRRPHPGRPEGHTPAPPRSLFGPERETRVGTPSSRSRSRRSRRTSLLPLRRRGLPRVPSLRLDRDRRRRDGRPERLRVRRLRPREGHRIRVRLGLERMALLRHGLPDIRALWENDLRLLEQF